MQKEIKEKKMLKVLLYIIHDRIYLKLDKRFVIHNLVLDADWVQKKFFWECKSSCKEAEL